MEDGSSSRTMEKGHLSWSKAALSGVELSGVYGVE